MAVSRPRLTLRALEPREAEVQAGVLRLCAAHPAVAWSMRANAGAGVMVRPPPGPDGWSRLKGQLREAVAAGCLTEAQIGWVRMGPEGCPDILGQMRSGHAFGLELKTPGKKPSVAQRAAITNIRQYGGLGAVVSDIEEANRLFNEWRKNHATAN
jgi:hypothetical protein